MRRTRLFLLALALLAGCADPDPPPPGSGETGEVTFFVAADTHYGAEGIAPRNRRLVAAMNALPGKPWPREIGGRVGRPFGVFVAGDLTDHGRASEWRAFAADYGRTGRDGRLRYPVFAGTGNHDRPGLLFSLVSSGPVLRGVAARHGGLVYALDRGDLHLVNLDIYPTAQNLRWLREDLSRVEAGRPVVILFHFPLAGPYSDWWRESEKEAFREAVRGRRVVAVFHGHYHGSGHYVWKGLDVYNVGSPRHSDHSIGVARWREGRLAVAGYDWDRDAWTWRHRKKADPVEIPASR